MSPCVLDDVKCRVKVKSRPIECFNRYEPLTQLDYSNETVSSSLNSDVQNDRENVDVDLVGSKAKALVRNKRERKLRLATWNFSGLLKIGYVEQRLRKSRLKKINIPFAKNILYSYTSLRYAIT